MDNPETAPRLIGHHAPEPTHALLRWFVSTHLPMDLAQVAGRYRALAIETLRDTKPGAEQTVALRKLLEAKDAAVRAAIELRG